MASITSAGQKRKRNESATVPSSRAKRQQKAFDARYIPTQTADAALTTAGELNIASFVKAREFEINALDKSMRKARQGLMTRAFQSVPRHLRRRTASHNAKKVPRRLRPRAVREMKEDNTPLVSSKTRTPSSKVRLRLETAKALKVLNKKSKTVRQKKREAKSNAEKSDPAQHVSLRQIPRLKKNKLADPPTATSKFKRRQIQKSWLPTHLWHAKRAHMTRPVEPLWRIAIPISPNEKSYRPSHRAAGSRGCVAWDMSYIATVGCLGTEMALESMLKAIGFTGDCWSGARHKQWKGGTRFASSWVSERDNDKRLIAQIDVIWCHHSVKSSPERIDESISHGDVDMLANERSTTTKKRKTKLDRRLMIRVHPSAFHQFWLELLKVAKLQKPQVLVEDLRFEIGSIDITGPGSTEALSAVLRPADSEGREAEVWKTLSILSNPASLPKNVLVSLDITDPRLHHPPKQIKLLQDETSSLAVTQLVTDWPLDNCVQPANLFSHKQRYLASRLPSQKAISRLKSSVPPGQTIKTKQDDKHIPTILMAHRSQSPMSSSQGTWTVLAPWRCIDLIWRSLMYYPLKSGGTPRFGGLQEKQQIAFEQGVPWFPADFPGTEAGKAWERTASEKRFDDWVRKPPSRRLAWDTVDLGLGRRGELGRGWACDWEFLFCGQSKNRASDAPKPASKQSQNKPSLTQRQRKAAKAQAAKQQETEVRRRNTSSPESDDEIKSAAHQKPDHSQMAPALAKSLLAHPLISRLPPKPALFSVKITLLTRGTPDPAARIYRLPSPHPVSQLISTAQKQTEQTDLLNQASVVDPTTTRSPSFHSSLISSGLAVMPFPSGSSLRSRWLALDSHLCTTSKPQVLPKIKTNRHSLPRRHTARPAESLRHINVLPKNCAPEVREKYGRKPLTEAEKQAELDALLKIKLEEDKVWDVHVPCPGPEDLVGFVTSGAYNLAEGKGTAIGALWIQRIVQGYIEWEGASPSSARPVNNAEGTSGPDSQKTKMSTKQHAQQKARERRLCIVRNAGESVGRLALWEICA